MAASASDREIGEAILQNVENRVYQPSAELAEVQLPSAAVPILIKGIENARERVKDEIRSLTKQAAPDIDGWIARAKEIQQDIKRSKATAQDIVRQAEAIKKSRARVEDAATKVDLLEKEMVFNETLGQTIGQIQGISATLRHAQDAAVRSQVGRALNFVNEATEAIGYLAPFENTRVIDVLQKQADQLKAAIAEDTTDCWNAILLVDASEKRITLQDEIERESVININNVVEAMSKLNILGNAISRLSRSVDNIIMTARLKNDRHHSPMEVHVDGDDISVGGLVKDFGVPKVLTDLNRIVEYLSTRLPPSIAVPMSDQLMPSVVSKLKSDWLDPSLPSSLEGLQEFQQTVVMVQNFAQSLDELGWSGAQELRDWAERVPYAWLQKKKEAALSEIRKLCLKGIQEKRVVERSETQMVSKDDAILQGQVQDDDDGWGAEWDQEESEAAELPSKPKPEAPKEEEDDADAWGWNEDDAADEAADNKATDGKDDTGEDAEDDAEAWGWGEDEENAPPAESSGATPKKPAPAASTNGEQPKSSTGQREITLKETYTITNIPDSLLGMIGNVISDMEKLALSSYSGLDVGTAIGQLSSLPGLMLAMYRATAAKHYSNDVAGNMLIYNDCTRIADQLRTMLDAQAKKDQSQSQQTMRPSALLYLDNDIKAIEGFGKRAYGTEMESQRTIIRDILDGAQGFIHCTEHPFAAVCDEAVAATLDRMREVHRNWKGILSHSALLQSVGSILAAVTGKMIMDIEDISDISEEASQRLRHFCLEIGKICDLFVAEDGSQGSGDLTSIYTPNWFKFQYLSEILDGSLADIKYLWTDGELRLEFEAEEVIDLIKALFAESDHRRKAISEIRRTATGG